MKLLYIAFLLLLLCEALFGQCPQITYNSNSGNFGSYQISFELDPTYWDNCGTDSNIEIAYSIPTGSCLQENFSLIPTMPCGSGGRKQYLSYNGCDYTYCRDASDSPLSSFSITIKQKSPAKEYTCGYSLKPDKTDGDVKSSDYCQYLLDTPLPVDFRNVFSYKVGCMTVIQFELDGTASVSLERSYGGFDYEPFIDGQTFYMRGKFAFYDCEGAYYRLYSDGKYSKTVSTVDSDTFGLVNSDGFIYCNDCGWDSYAVYSVNGLLLAEGDFDGYTNLSWLPKGFYIIVLDNGLFTHSYRFLKE